MKTTIPFGDGNVIAIEERPDGSVRVCRGRTVVGSDGEEVLEVGPSMTYRPEELPELAAYFVRTWDRQRQEAILLRTQKQGEARRGEGR